MVYLTHYEEYPIYEPAEGGYYYAGNEVISTEKLSVHAAKKKLMQMLAECEKEVANERETFGTQYPYVWVNSDNRSFGIVNSRYIGDGESFVIERRLGSEKRGRVPYC